MNPMNVLYVEDNPMDADLTARELSRSAPHITLTIVGTLQEARARLAQTQGPPYDLVLADRQLPDGDGLSLLSQIREQHPSTATIIVTGSGDEEYVVSALKAGADDYVVKHGDYLARLPNILEAALDNHRRAITRRQRPLRVLYAEHNLADIDLTRRHLAHHAPYIHLEVVHTALDTLHRLPPDGPEHDIDVLLADLRLPGMNGLELLKEIREARRLDLPVVLVTGRGDEETALLALRLGATDYLPKLPNYLNRLPVVLENAFHRVELAREREALRASEELFRTLAAMTAGAIFVYQGERFVYGNPAIEALTGYPREELRTMRFWDLVHPDFRDLVRERGLARQRGEPVLDRYELKIVRKDGAERWIDLTAGPITWQGRPAAIGTAFDITERKQMEEQLERVISELTRSNAELERFAYVASHDLQEPLRMVASFVQLLAERYRGRLDADADDFIGYAVEGAQRMQQLILDLLAFSRVDMSIRPFEPTDCEEVLAYVERSLGGEIAETAAQIIHDPLPTVLADRAQLVQLFSHLIFNALKFRSAAAPIVHIRAVRRPATGPQPARAATSQAADQPPTEWLFSVADNGIGIEPQYHEYIFNAFRRLHTRRHYPGTGIGLAICKKIVERHGGRIWVESEPGKGSTFYFTLPAAP